MNKNVSKHEMYGRLATTKIVSKCFLHPHMCVPAIRDSKHSLTRPFYDPTCETGCCALKGCLAQAFADSPKDSPDEVPRPPRCPCSKNHKPKKINF